MARWILLTILFGFSSCTPKPTGERLLFKHLEFPVTFEQRAQMYKTVEIPSEIFQRWNGKQVHMVGYMLPLSIDKEVDEFMLVQSHWSCCYGQPPDINQVVYIKTPKKIPFYQQGVLVEGMLTVKKDMAPDGYLRSLYQMMNAKVREFDTGEKPAPTPTMIMP